MLSHTMIGVLIGFLCLFRPDFCMAMDIYRPAYEMACTPEKLIIPAREYLLITDWYLMDSSSIDECFHPSLWQKQQIHPQYIQKSAGIPVAHAEYLVKDVELSSFSQYELPQKTGSTAVNLKGNFRIHTYHRDRAIFYYEASYKDYLSNGFVPLELNQPILVQSEPAQNKILFILMQLKEVRT